MQVLLVYHQALPRAAFRALGDRLEQDEEERPRVPAVDCRETGQLESSY